MDFISKFTDKYKKYVFFYDLKWHLFLKCQKGMILLTENDNIIVYFVIYWNDSKEVS